MTDIGMMPIAGINNVAEDAALIRGGDDPRVQVRDIINMDISPAGKATLRSEIKKVDTDYITNLWQSPLHKDVFGRQGDKLVRVAVNESPWVTEELATIGNGSLSFCVLNNLVCVAGDNGIYTYNGQKAQRLTIDTPPSPFLIGTKDGAMKSDYLGLAVSWLRGSIEGPLSAIAMKELGDGSVQVTMPLCMDDSITSVRLYATTASGGILYRYGTYDISETQITIPYVNEVGEEAKFKNLSPMVTGNYLSYWKGRLVTAKGNTIRFSEAMAYHLHDERHGFVQMPQRITFLEPVDGGLWVGQVDYVAFLQGSSPEELTLHSKTASAPVPSSAIQLQANTISAELSQGGMATVLWLAENGYVAGNANGQVIELHSGVIKGITASKGTSIVIDRRVITAVT